MPPRPGQHNRLPRPEYQIPSVQCPDHGEAYDALNLQLGELSNLAHPNLPATSDEFGRAAAARGEAAQEVYTGLRAGLELREDVTATAILGACLKRGSTLARSEAVADIFADKVGRPLTVLDATFALAGIMDCCRDDRPMASLPEEEQGGRQTEVVYSTITAVINKINPEDLCERYFGDNLQSIQKRTMQVALQLAQLGFNRIAPEVFAEKLLLTEVKINDIRRLYDTLKGIQSPEMSQEMVDRLAEQNDLLAQGIKKIRHYGVKSLIFPSKVLPGHDLVHHSVQTLEEMAPIPATGVAGIVFIAKSSTASEAKLSRQIEQLYPDETEGQTIQVLPDGLLLTLSLQESGELILSYGHAASAVNLKAIFKQHGTLGQYEHLRAEYLTQLFAAVAPAKIVKRIDEETQREIARTGESPTSNTEDTVLQMLLPRVRYLSQQPESIAVEFDEALNADAQTLVDDNRTNTASHFKFREVAHCFPRLAEGAHSTTTALDKAREYLRDPDFEMPEGRTFRKPHTQGKKEAGAVIGHTAILGGQPNPEQA